MPAAIAAVRQAFIALSDGSAVAPLRTAITQERHDGVTLVMPGYLPDEIALAVKVVSVHQQNPLQNLPLIHGLVLVLEPRTGQPLALMEGGYLTALRTGAASGLATDLLARKETEVAAIIGAGGQARTQIAGITAVRNFKRILIYDRHPERTASLIDEMRSQVPEATELLAAKSAAAAVSAADVICTVTTSRQPVFAGALLKPGVHINALGSYHPEMQEVDTTTLQRADRIVIDARAGALAEAGDLLMALRQGAINNDDIDAELGEIAAGLKPGRQHDQEITYFKSVGNAAQDVAVAQAIYQQSLKLNLGIELDLLQ